MVYSDYIYVLNKYADETKEKKKFSLHTLFSHKNIKAQNFFSSPDHI